MLQSFFSGVFAHVLEECMRISSQGLLGETEFRFYGGGYWPYRREGRAGSSRRRVSVARKFTRVTRSQGKRHDSDPPRTTTMLYSTVQYRTVLATSLKPPMHRSTISQALGTMTRPSHPYPFRAAATTATLPPNHLDSTIMFPILFSHIITVTHITIPIFNIIIIPRSLTACLQDTLQVFRVSVQQLRQFRVG